MSGARPVLYPAGDDGNVAAILAAIEAAGGQAAAVIVCNPGNPRGEVMAPGALNDVAKAAAAGALLIVDANPAMFTQSRADAASASQRTACEPLTLQGRS